MRKFAIGFSLFFLLITASTAFAQDAYTVRGGDTLATIAARYNVSLDALMQANGLTNPNVVFAGQTLIIPTTATTSTAFGTGGPTTSTTPNTVDVIQANGTVEPLMSYTVVSGDTVTAIAANYGITVDVLLSLNNLSNANLIRVGDTLQLPAGSQPVVVNQPTTASVPTVREYTVQNGDMISLLALEWGVSEEAIIAANNLANPSRIFPGDILQIP